MRRRSIINVKTMLFYNGLAAGQGGFICPQKWKKSWEFNLNAERIFFEDFFEKFSLQIRATGIL